jgi:proteasome lid subunit RPN8/RPN11
VSQSHPIVPPAALAEIYAQARAEYPKECCGIIFGAKGSDVADRVRVCRNMQDEWHAEDPVTFPRDATIAYNLSTDDQRLVDRGLDAQTPTKIIYHSHIDVGAYFSAEDRAAACPFGEPSFPVEHLVVDVKKDGTHGAKQFAWDDERQDFIEVRTYP